jgi:hypothetical protein
MMCAMCLVSCNMGYTVTKYEYKPMMHTESVVRRAFFGAV